MKRKFILFLSVIVMFFAITDTYAQKTKPVKLTKEQKRDAQNEKRRVEVLSMVQAKSFSFTVRSIDSKSSPTMSYNDLRGGYMIKVTPSEFSAHLPLLGPNQRAGNAPGGNDLNFGTRNYKIELEDNPEVGVRVIIKATDPRSGFVYTFVIAAKDSVEKLVVLVAALQDVTFLGSMRAIK